MSKNSGLWKKVEKLPLKTNMKVHLSGDKNAGNFSDLLLKIGEGKLGNLQGQIDLSERLGIVDENLKTLIEKVYPDLKNFPSKNSSWIRERAILTPKNDSASEINELILKKLSGNGVTYTSFDSVIEVEDAVNYPVEFMNSVQVAGIPSHSLFLKVGAPIMLLRNLKPPALCNGTRLQVKTLHKNVIEATILTGCGTGQDVFIPRIPLVPTDYPIQFKRLQFPVRLCFAMTINKSQGQNLKLAGVDLRTDCFSHGQLYVACSRVSSPKSLILLQPENRTTNIVYEEVFK